MYVYGCDTALGGTALSVRMAVLRVVSRVELSQVRHLGEKIRQVDVVSFHTLGSATLHCRSVLNAVRIPRRTNGRVSIQCEVDECALRADMS